ncbi:hypothetical protein LCGC14_1750080 [marine sediment metagenome]|uniref:Uncharacterized protein n=1 Tax=marine sediment metagenome TaxID=412755 RepID=A0A0F9K3N9_9ZZZZ
MENEQAKALCYYTEYPCGRTNCDTYIICKAQYKKNGHKEV